jgi:hypothetical protein
VERHALVLVLLVALSFIFVPTSQSGATGLAGSAIETPGLSTLDLHGATTTAIACTSSSDCTAGGYYTDSSFAPQAYVVDEASGLWGYATPIPGLNAMNAGGSAHVAALTCPSSGNCVAGGVYSPASSTFQVFLAQEVNGVWQNAFSPLGLSALNAGNDAELTSVSCASVGNCVAGGLYRNAGTFKQGFLVEETSGAWGSAITIPGFGGAGISYVASQILAVSCPSPGNCAGAGTYDDTHGNRQAFVVNEVSDTWQSALEVPGTDTTGGLNTGGYVAVNGLSCATGGTCVVVGTYNAGSGHTEAFVDDETSGTWGTAQEAPGTAALNSHNVALNSVSCSSAGNCSAVGYYGDSTDTPHGMTLDEVGGTWQSPTLLTEPSSAGSGLFSVSCFSDGDCLAGGSYSDSTGNNYAVVASETSGTWGSETEATGLATLGSNTHSSFSQVSCGVDGTCSGVGEYVSGASTEGFVVGVAAPPIVTLYDNTSVDGLWTSSAGVELAQSFNTDASGESLGAVTIHVRNANFTNTSSSPSSTYSVYHYSSVAAHPGSLLATFVTNETTTSFEDQLITFPLSTPVALAPSTQYFIVVSGSSGGTLGWKYNHLIVTTNVSPTPTFSSLISSNSGTSWSSTISDFIMSVQGQPLTATTLSSFANVNATLGQTPQTIVAPTPSVPGTFLYTSSNPSVASVSGSQLNFVATGTTTITAQFTPQDATFFAPATATMTVTVAPAVVVGPVATTTTSTTTTTTTTTPVKKPPTTTTTPSGPSSPSSGATTTTTLPASAATTSTTTTTPSDTSTTTTLAGAGSTSTSSGDSGPPTEPYSDPVASPPSNDIFSGNDGYQVVAQLQVTPGDVASGAPFYVSASGADPGSSITVVIHSTPTTVVNGTIGTDGTFSTNGQLPSTVEPGQHLFIADAVVGGQTQEVVGAFTVDTKGDFVTIVQPAIITGFTGKNDPRIQRALRFGVALYDVKSHTHSTAAVLVAGGAVLALVGSGGLVGRTLNTSGSSSSSSSKHQHQSKVASATTKKLKALTAGDSAWGDKSTTWQTSITHHVDAFSRTYPFVVGSYSALMPRLLLDGAWIRAVLGARALVLWFVGLVLGVLTLFFHSGAPFVPSVTLLFVIVGLAIFDATAGALAWLVIALCSLVSGQIQGWADFRTLLGLGVLVATVPLLAHAIRPLRRYVADSTSERWERLIDYTLMPLFLAFAVSSMAKALDGLSGLTILSPTNIADVRWLVGGLILARLIGEDLAAHFYPERSRNVQPPKLAAPKIYVSYGSLIFKFALYLLVMDPYFGVTWTTVLAALLLAIPGVMKLYENKLPNSKILHRWLPRGFTSFVFMMVLGSFVAYEILGPNGTGGSIKTNFLWLLVPGLVFSVLEEFGREGTDWTNEWVRRVLGLGVWFLGAGIVTGGIVLFG